MKEKAIYKKIQRKTHLLQFLPIQLKELLSGKSKIFFNGKMLKTDYLIDLSNSLICRYYFKKDKTNLSISSEVCRMWYGTFYNYYISYMVSIGFIRLHKNYVNIGNGNGRCNIYELNKDFLKDVTRVENKNTKILAKWKANFLLKNGIDERKRIDKALKIQLIEDMLYVEVDYEQASKLLEELKKEDNIDDFAYHRNRLCILRISDGNLYHKEDNYGRLHTNFTTLKKTIRNRFTTIDGETIGETDIKNSQPFFLSYYLRSNASCFSSINAEEYTRFASTVENGMIYDLIANEGNMSRDKAKKLVYRVLFGKTTMQKLPFRLFNRLFPSINRAIATIKSTSGNHKFLAHELQRLESEIIFNKICRRVKKECKGIRIFTVHDSLFYQKKYTEEVSRIFEQELSLLKITS